LGITRNGEAATSTGVELNTRWQVTDELQLAAIYAYNQAEMTEFSPGLVDGQADAYDGDRLAGSPEHQGTLQLAYQRPLENGYTVGADYSLSAVSDVYTKVGLRNNGEALGGYSVHGASVTVGRDQWSARLYADNLLDKYAVTSVRRDRSYIRAIERSDGSFVDSRTYFQSMLRPRTIGLELTYRFEL
jgi:outer membrane receptor protein involved in Fe transport